MAGISAFLSRTPHIKMPRVRGTSWFESKSGRYGDCAYSKWPAGAEALFKKWRAPEHELQAVIFRWPLCR